MAVLKFCAAPLYVHVCLGPDTVVVKKERRLCEEAWLHNAQQSNDPKQTNPVDTQHILHRQWHARLGVDYFRYFSLTGFTMSSKSFILAAAGTNQAAEAAEAAQRSLVRVM